MKLGEKTVQLHINMLGDRARTETFLRAVGATVRRGDVVVDIGTGTGVLAVAAARAGARRVYAVESGPVREVARRVFEVNGVADRVTLIAGHSTDIELPERADVLVSEVIGNEPLGERVLETTADAAARLLKPRARLLPRGVRIYGLPVHLPASERRKLTFTPEALGDWRAWYGIDFSPLAGVNSRALLVHFLGHRRVRPWRALCDPVPLAEIDFRRFRGPQVGSRRVARAARAGTLDGLVVYFELDVAEGETITTHPAEADPANHWLNPVYVFADPMPLRAGDEVAFTYTYNMAEHTEWINVRGPG